MPQFHFLKRLSMRQSVCVIGHRCMSRQDFHLSRLFSLQEKNRMILYLNRSHSQCIYSLRGGGGMCLSSTVCQVLVLLSEYKGIYLASVVIRFNHEWDFKYVVTQPWISKYLTTSLFVQCQWLIWMFQYVCMYVF